MFWNIFFEAASIIAIVLVVSFLIQKMQNSPSEEEN